MLGRHERRTNEGRHPELNAPFAGAFVNLSRFRERWREGWFCSGRRAILFGLQTRERPEAAPLGAAQLSPTRKGGENI